MMTDDQLREVLGAKIEEADRLMTESCEGGLQYGWDWPTFAVLFPEQYVEIQRLKAEGRKRGLHKTPPSRNDP